MNPQKQIEEEISSQQSSMFIAWMSTQNGKATTNDNSHLLGSASYGPGFVLSVLYPSLLTLFVRVAISPLSPLVYSSTIN